jgi:hypothetical protein
MTRLLIGILILVVLLTNSAGAERELPSQTDLRAAYCIAIVQNAMEVFKPSSMDAESWVSPEDLAALRAEFAGTLRRLQLYLLPRMPHLELLGLATARQRAKEDLAQSERYSASCATKCKQSANKRASAEQRASAEVACGEKCRTEDPVRPRLKECYDLRWLPY